MHGKSKRFIDDGFTEVGLSRADSGFYDNVMVALLKSKNISHIIIARLTQALQQSILGQCRGDVETHVSAFKFLMDNLGSILLRDMRPGVDFSISLTAMQRLLTSLGTRFQAIQVRNFKDKSNV